MSEEATTATQNETPNVEETSAEKTTRTFTQEELDQVVKSRLERERAKYSDYDTLKEQAHTLDTLQAEKAKAEERLNELEAELKHFKHQEEVRSWADAVSKETGIDPSIIRGSTLEEMQAHAEAIKQVMAKSPAYPTLNDAPANSTPTLTKAEILGIKDADERKRAIAENIHLF